MQAIINPIVQFYVDSYSTEPLQAILIEGPKGSGKKYIAQTIINKIKSNEHIEQYNLAPKEDKKHIGIDQIIQLKSSLRTKQPYRMFVTIKDADMLTKESQNSLLKILEEPPSKVHFIMTSSYLSKILETIKSRVIIWRYLPPNQETQKKYVQNINPDLDPTSLLALANGRMGLLSALVNTQEKHPLRINIDLVKEVLSETTNQRLLRVDRLSKDIEQAYDFLDALSLLCQAAAKLSIQNNAIYSKWLYRLKESNESIKMIQANVQPKLVLTRLLLVL